MGKAGTVNATRRKKQREAPRIERAKTGEFRRRRSAAGVALRRGIIEGGGTCSAMAG